MDSLEILKDAAAEIKRLRQKNQLMQARLDMFDDVMLLLRTAPKIEHCGMSPDIVYAIEKQIEIERRKA